MIGKPLVRKGSLYSFATGELPLLASPALAFCTTLGVPVYFSGGSWYKISDDSLVISLLAWTPAGISTVAWYDAADAATITESSGLVSEWADKSGNGNHAIQGVGVNQPTLVDGFLNSRGVVNFNGTTAKMDTTFALTFNMQFQLYMVAKGSVGKPLNVVNGATNIYCSYTSAGASSRIIVYTDNAKLIASAPTITYAPHFFCYERNMETVSTVVDGVYNTSPVQAGAGATTLPNVATIGPSLNGYIAEMLLVDGLLSTDDRQKVEGYLAWKWGLEANLPSGHPYELAAP